MASPIERAAPVYVESGHTARVNALMGIPTVVRGLIGGLSSRGCAVHPVRWSFRRNGLTLLKSKWEENLGRPGGRSPWLPVSSLRQPRFWPAWFRAAGLRDKIPLHRHPAHAGNFGGGWVILPELLEGSQVRLITEYARQHAMRVAGIFHDAIPWLHPAVVRHRSREQHADYMRAFAELDVVIPVSRQSARDFMAFLESEGRPPPPVKICGLAAEIAGQERESEFRESPEQSLTGSTGILPVNGIRPRQDARAPSGSPPSPASRVGSRRRTVKILCVGTLEPRKNHARVIEAFQLASSRFAAGDLELHLVGAAYAGDPEIARTVREITTKNPRIIWHESAGSGELRDLYRNCDFTVFGSWIEGFGLPVMESLWFGQPCLCSDEGVMAENAAGGGCLMVDVQNVGALADGMGKLAGQPDFRRELAEQAMRRKLKTWDGYAGEIRQILKET